MVSAVLSAMSALPASMLLSDAHSNQPHSPHSPLPSPPDANSAKQPPNSSRGDNSFTTPHSSAASSPASAASSALSSNADSPRLHATPDDDSEHRNGHHSQELSPPPAHTPLPPISEDDTPTPMDTSSADHVPASPAATVSNPSSPQPASASAPFSPSSGSDPSASKRRLTVEIPALSAAASSAVTPLPPLHPGAAAATARYDVWMTPAQARAESKKLKGYRWIPAQPQPPASAAPAGVAAQREEKRVRKERKYDDELSTITTPNPAVKREKDKTGGQQTPGGGRRQSGSSAAPTGSSVAQPPASPYSTFAPPTPRTVPPKTFKRQSSAPVLNVPSAAGVSVRALELRLEALKQQQAILLAAAPSPSPAPAIKKRKSTPASFPSQDTKKAKTPDFAVPASPSASPSFSSTFPSSSTAAASPTVHGASPQLTRTGRSIRTPTHFSAVDPITLSSDLRRAKHVVELLMAYKPAFGVFNAPVNYDDPTKPYFATGYLDIIKGKAMDLGTVKATLSEGGYDGLEDFAADVRQVWRNAQLFNPPEDWIHTVSQECEKIFEHEMHRIMEMAQRETERKNKRAQERAERDAAKLANPDAAASGMLHPALDEFGFPSASLSEVPMQRASTGPSVRPVLKSRVSMPGGVGGGAGAGRPLALKEKQMLKDDIFKLPPHKLGPVVEIISKSSTSVAGDDDEIEIDIDKLDVATLRELQEYVKKALAPPPRTKTKPPGMIAGRRSTTPRHSPSGSILQSPPRLSTPEREANAPPSPSVASVHSMSSVGASSKPIRYESDESSDDDSDDERGKKALPPVVLPMADDNEDDDSLPVNNSAWSNLTAANPASSSFSSKPSSATAAPPATAPTTASSSIGGGSDKLWDDFKTKEAEQRRKEREKEASEAQRRAQREEELAARLAEVEAARRAREEQEAAERRVKVEAEEREWQRIEAERRSAREARDQDEAAMADDDKSQDELRRLERLAH